MKIKHLSRIWWLLFLAGIIIGAVCAGLCIRKLQMSEVQSVLYVQQLKDAQYHIEGLFGRIFLRRIILLAGLLLSVYVCKIPVPMVLATLFFGLAAGYLMTVMAAGYGIRGYFFLCAMILPQYIFYVLAYMLILRMAVLKYKDGTTYTRYAFHSGRAWHSMGILIGCIVLLVTAGVACEAYVTPGIVQQVVRRF